MAVLLDVTREEDIEHACHSAAVKRIEEMMKQSHTPDKHWALLPGEK